MTRHVNWDHGIALPDHALWLDPQVVRAHAFISHAHTDHARRHKNAFLTAETLALIAAPRRPHSPRVLELGEPVQINGGTATLLASGHMLGSAQILFEDGGRLLYTGDLKLRLGAARPQTVVPRADVLILESTYGLPAFRFPDPDSIVELIAIWCRKALDSRVTPVLLAHAVGKAQEVMIALAPYGFTFALEERCVPAANAYRELGIEMPDFVQLDGDPGSERVVIAPPAGKDEIRRIGRYRTALVSGWAQDPSFWRVFGSDVAFPYSDHCDFDELWEVVERSGATQVYTVHGYTEELARHLRKRGVRAYPLHATEQLALAL
jgi:Cft2 family RNA processing exonuclease